jgi:hypothetical protein
MKVKSFRSVGWCDACDKHLYTDKARARKVARLHTEHMGVYRCPVLPAMWHVGTLADAIIRGEATRGQIYRGAA